MQLFVRCKWEPWLCGKEVVPCALCIQIVFVSSFAFLCMPGQAEDLDSGEYKAYFRATKAGSYAVSATLGGQNIAGSPFAAVVTAVETNAGCSYVCGAGVTAACSGQLVSHTDACITLRTKLTFSNEPGVTCVIRTSLIIIMINYWDKYMTFDLPFRGNLCVGYKF